MKIERLKAKANYFLKNSCDEAKPQREGVLTFVSDILMDTREYKGFRYLLEDDMETSPYGYSYGLKDSNSTEVNDGTRVQFL